jgi:hypothetical protein
MNSPRPVSKRFGIRHWFFQAAPPSILLLATLLGTRNGTALVFLAGLFIIPVLVSLLSIVFKLLDLSNRKYFVLRPSLTVFFFATILTIAHLTYEAALDDVTYAAESLRQQCRTQLACPEQPDGWNRDGQRLSRRDLGVWYKYSATYVYDPHRFDIRVYQGPDLGHIISGGIDMPVAVSAYIED